MPSIRLTALLCLLPLAAAAPCDGQETRPYYMSGIISENGKTEHVWIDTRNGIEMRSSGAVDLTGDGRDVTRIAPGGYLDIQEGTGASRRRMEYRPGPEGAVHRSYSVGGTRRELDAAALAWAAGFLDRAARVTSLGAEARARRILAEGGIAALVAEIPRLESGSRQRTYLQEALRSGRLRPEDTRTLLQGVAAVSSSSEKREMLSELAGAHAGIAGFWPEWLRAVGTVGTGSDRRELLLRAVRELPRDQAPPAALFTALDGISSGSDRREVLIALVTKWGGSAPTLQRALDSTARLTSSSDRREVLAALLRSPLPLSRDASVQWLRAVGSLKSDSDKATLLTEAIGRLPRDRAVGAAFTAAVETISSDTYYNQVATAYLRSQTERS